MAKKGLGRGLDALLADNSTERESISSGITLLQITDIEPNLKQVRRTFDDSSLSELSASIKEHGLIQPIVVRKTDNGFYEIVAGERRWRASKMAGLTEVPVIIRDTDNETASLLAMVENLQREDLNPVEEAAGYKAIMDSYGYTQEEVSDKVGKSRSAVANSLRILSLPDDILIMVKSGELSAGHGRTLLSLSGKVPDGEIISAAKKIIAEGLSVRAVEKMVKSMLQPKTEKQTKVQNEYYRHIESRASEKLGRKLSIHENDDGKGTVTLSYGSNEDLEILLKSICGKAFFESDELK